MHNDFVINTAHIISLHTCRASIHARAANEIGQIDGDDDEGSL